MEDIHARHRKEQRDLQARITQKKKSVTKKTRKGVNAECDELERQLRENHEQELAAGEQELVVNGGDKHEGSPAQHETTSNGGPLDSDAPEAAKRTESSSPAQASTPSRKPNRQKARLARRAAEQEAQSAQAADEAANLPDLREQERTRMLGEITKRGLKEKEIRPDGHCLYSAVADQLSELGVGLQPRIGLMSSANEEDDEVAGYCTVRRAAAAYMRQHPEDFEGFLEEPLEDYTTKIRDTAEWGGQLELLALARAYGVKINVVQGDGRIEAIEPGDEGDAKVVWLAYYRHHFGLGEHYNSLQAGTARVP
ncbi:MAG: hypothetical protein M1833_005270 [Piccolia ochrophora]|nr:MAG: hypothetical protein M1833_005270 [Piccolia ochrophora]